ncbi:flavin reductase [Ktedonobacter sp. SOSP1-52]|uniref:flavin reductase family protein n=1 Tax=Ktedonobacter sp. SOSP1-52 TaxID=2778366 RepID=UPI0019151EEB|nr:flavin reductase family protein [Ktedonobacter sp. SOSP1-52]GHO67607.1 flavin reductase [Ktedonobacter sp. SOSP1-52]
MALEKIFFRQVMGRFATGVTVVTTRHQEVLGGLTVNAFCSVSLEPPLILICVDLKSQTLPLIRDSKVFAVNMLTQQQEELSNCFATSSPERFDFFCNATHHTAVTGAPILDKTLAFIDARVVAEYPGGDHSIFLGQVAAMGTAERTLFVEDGFDQHYDAAIANGQNGSSQHADPSPLLYYQGQYRHLGNLQRKPTLTTTGTAHEDGSN